MRDFGNQVPKHLTRKLADGSSFWDPTECFSIHTVDWWLNHWQKTGLVDVETADTIPQGGDLWLRWAESLEKLGLGYSDEAPALREDQGRYLGFIRLVARRKDSAK